MLLYVCLCLFFLFFYVAFLDVWDGGVKEECGGGRQFLRAVLGDFRDFRGCWVLREGCGGTGFGFFVFYFNQSVFILICCTYQGLIKILFRKRILLLNIRFENYRYGIEVKFWRQSQEIWVWGFGFVFNQWGVILCKFFQLFGFWGFRF